MSKRRSPLLDCSSTVGISAIVLTTPLSSRSRSRSRRISISYSRYHRRGRDRGPMTQRRHEPVFPGFKEMAQRRRALTADLVAHRRALGLSQTEAAARMGTSQSAVARLETGSADVRLPTLERDAAALGP